MTVRSIAAPAARGNSTTQKPISKELVLAELRVAAARARLFQHEIEAIGLALSEGITSPATALMRMRDAGVVMLCDQQPGDTVNSGDAA
jgi:hypothetical protein